MALCFWACDSRARSRLIPLTRPLCRGGLRGVSEEAFEERGATRTGRCQARLDRWDFRDERVNCGGRAAPFACGVRRKSRDALQPRTEFRKECASPRGLDADFFSLSRRLSSRPCLNKAVGNQFKKEWTSEIDASEVTCGEGFGSVGHRCHPREGRQQVAWVPEILHQAGRAETGMSGAHRMEFIDSSARSIARR